MLNPLARMRRRLPVPANPPDGPSSSNQPPKVEYSPRPGGFAPLPADVYYVRALLRTINIPAEIALLILSFADYRPRIHSHRGETVHVSASANPSNQNASLYLSSPSLPVPNKAENETYKPAYVKFTTRSCDQGWGGEARHRKSYHGSWTWLEACILRPIPGQEHTEEPFEVIFSRQPTPRFLEPSDARESIQEQGWDFVSTEDDKTLWQIQRNRTSTSEPLEHTVEWRVGVDGDGDGENGKGNDDGFLELMQPGDRVALWARALVS